MMTDERFQEISQMTVAQFMELPFTEQVMFLHKEGADDYNIHFKVERKKNSGNKKEG